MNNNIMDIIAAETRGKSYRTYKYTFDNFDDPSFVYDDYREITWERYGETDPSETPINLKHLADKIIKIQPLFTYFLDGSRHTYKVDDIAYKNKVYPVIAGQIGVSCCKRIEKNMQKHWINLTLKERKVIWYKRLLMKQEELHLQLMINTISLTKKL